MSRLTPLSEQDPPRIGPYRLIGRVGTGGQATVYFGVNVTSGKEAAVKVLHVAWGSDGNSKQDLRQELINARKVAAGITAEILGFDLDGTQPYIASEYIEGSTLADTVRDKGVLSSGSLSGVAVQTMLSLEAIHAARVVHCDFKPANVILSPHGPRVIDFGIARALESTHQAGRAAGTLHFMAPEQIEDRRLTSAVDLFAWGATIVYAATGRYAFPGAHREAVIYSVLHAPPQLYDLAEPLRGLIAACLSKDPAKRPTAAQARQALLGLHRPARPRKPDYQPGVAAGRPGVAAGRPPSPPTRVERPVLVAENRNPLWKPLTMIAAAVLAMAGAVLWFSPDSSGQPTSEPSPTPPPPPIAVYNEKWPDRSCSPTSVIATAGQTARIRCEVSSTAGPVEKYCVEYVRTDVRNESARPREHWKSIADVEWTDRWTRDDDPVGGLFISYTLAERDRAAIWWESDTEPLACLAFGDRGTGDALVQAFLDQGFKLKGR